MQTHLVLIRSFLLLSFIFASGCGDDTSGTDAGGTDSGGTDSVGIDSGGTDSAGTDSGGTDSVGTDSAGTDAGGTDAGGTDSGVDHGTAMSFFVTSEALTGDGNLGGLEAADAHCVALARAADSPRGAWVAYLSTSTVNAIDRIGSGPWYNADEEVFSPSVTELHLTIDAVDNRDEYIAAKPADALFMDENGDMIGGRQHDIFTGSQPDGTLMEGETCQDWNSNDADDTGQVGHSDTPTNIRFSPSWNSAHNTAGCDASGVEMRGGAGLFFCFATD